MYYNNSNQTTVSCDINELSCSATINNLAPFTPYIIEVSCSTGAGEGPRTNSTRVNTTIGSEFNSVTGLKIYLDAEKLYYYSYVFSWHKDKTVMYVQVKWLITDCVNYVQAARMPRRSVEFEWPTCPQI